MPQETRVQVNIPFHMLRERLADVVRASINPEIYFDAASLDSLEPGEIVEAAGALSGAGLRTTIHGPYMDLSPGGADERVRALTAERYEFLIEATAPLHPVSIVLHAGYDAARFDGNVPLWLSQSLKTWVPVVELAELHGVIIAVENVFETEPAPIVELVHSVGSPAFGVCLDAGHINLFSKVPMEEWFTALGPFIKEVHLHDNQGERDDHLPIGEGRIDFKRFFELLFEHSGRPVYTIEPHGEGALWRGLEAVREYV